MDDGYGRLMGALLSTVDRLIDKGSWLIEFRIVVNVKFRTRWFAGAAFRYITGWRYLSDGTGEDIGKVKYRSQKKLWTIVSREKRGIALQ